MLLARLIRWPFHENILIILQVEATEEDCQKVVQSCEIVSEWKSKNVLSVDGIKL